MRTRYRITLETNVYFITISTHLWVPILFNDEMFQIVMNSMKYCRAHKGMNLHGYVIMINHLHAIISHEQSGQIPSIVRDFKRHTATRISEYMCTLGRFSQLFWLRMFHTQDRGQGRIWQPGYHPIAIRSPQFFEQKLTYIHNNPVKKGFVIRPQDWKYSSARNYLLGDDSLVEIDRIGQSAEVR